MSDSLTILVADDNEFISTFLKDEINKHKGFEVVDIALTSKQEIEMIDKYRPDVVITDIRKSNGDSGLDIIKLYNEKDYKPEFVVISAYDKTYYFHTLLELNIKHYIRKPFLYESVIDILVKIKG